MTGETPGDPSQSAPSTSAILAVVDHLLDKLKTADILQSWFPSGIHSLEISIRLGDPPTNIVDLQIRVNRTIIPTNSRSALERPEQSEIQMTKQDMLARRVGSHSERAIE